MIGVMKGAPADEAEIQVGDTIIAARGKPAATLHVYELRRGLWSEAPGPGMRLTIKRDGDTKQMKVTLRDLI